MRLYKKYVLPQLIMSGCNKRPQMRQRAKVIPHAKGAVLEVGIGSGLNLPFYDCKNVTKLVGIDPSIELWNKREHKKINFPFEFIPAIAENLPFEKKSFDSIVITYTLCSIEDFKVALESLRKVIKPTGKLLFCEHGKAPDKKVKNVQNLINPIWKIIGGGCNINRDIPLMISENGFEITHLNKMYVPGWKPVSYNFWGEAKPS